MLECKIDKDKSGIMIVDGVSDAKTIAFAEHFSKVCTNSTIAGNERLRSDITIVVT